MKRGMEQVSKEIGATYCHAERYSLADIVALEPTVTGVEYSPQFAQVAGAADVMVVANFENDVPEYWEWSGQGLFPFDASNEAYKLGVNYLIYGLTH